MDALIGRFVDPMGRPLDNLGSVRTPGRRPVERQAPEIEETRKTLDRGRRVREVLKQPQYEPIPVPEQTAVLVAVTGGIFDQISLDQIPGAEQKEYSTFLTVIKSE